MSTNSTTQPQQIASFWIKAWEDHLARVSGVFAEWEKAEGQAHERANTQADELARLGKATLDYGFELASAWRAMTLDATKKAIGAASAATANTGAAGAANTGAAGAATRG